MKNFIPLFEILSRKSSKQKICVVTECPGAYTHCKLERTCENNIHLGIKKLTCCITSSSRERTDGLRFGKANLSITPL